MTKRFLSWIVLISGCLAATAALSQPTDFDDFVTGEDFVLRGKDLVIRDNQDRIRMRFDAQTSDIRIFGPGGNLIALFEQRGRNLDRRPQSRRRSCPSASRGHRPDA